MDARQIIDGRPGDKVHGIYYHVPFTGKINVIRFHTANIHKMVVFVNLDQPITVLGATRERLCMEPHFNGIEEMGEIHIS